ncbi:LacI family DNA-binding transcriptional regulator [Paenibacillus marinisediminis]
MAKLKDIAAHVGVSISTVSRVLSYDESRRISKETKQKILEAAKEFNYHSPHEGKAKRHMKQSSIAKPSTAYSIGCILSMPDNKYNHPYFSPILQGIEAKLQEEGVLLSFLHTQAELKNAAVRESIEKARPLSGIIVIEGLEPSTYKWLKRNGTRIVGIDVGDPDIPVISYDRMNAARAAVRHLAANGHERIGFIGGTGLFGHLEREKRYRGYRHALEEMNLVYHPEWTINAEWDADTSYNEMRRLLETDQLPTAMFCASDMMAIAAMRAVTERGLRIPEDVAFIGIDNIDVAKYSSPPLSSVHIPKYEMGYAAAKTLLDSLKDPYPFPYRMLLPFEIMVRASSSKPKHEDGAS